MRVATYNVNGVNGRLPVLLRWLAEDGPDVACLQELKAPQEGFPRDAIRALGYEAIWQGQKSWNGVALLSRSGEIHETRRALPGDPDDSQCRYIEAAVGGMIVAGLYLPNGNPRPGPKFDYKLSARPWATGWSAPGLIVMSAAGKSRATTHRCGSSWRTRRREPYKRGE